MRRGVVYSAVLHGLVGLVTLGALPHLLPEPAELPPVLPVELLTIDELTNVKAQEKAKEPEKVEEKPAEPEPEPVRQAALPPEPEPAPEPEAMPLPQEEEKPKQEEKPLTAAAAPRLKPKPPTPPKKSFDATRIAALLNKIPPKEASENVDEERVKPQAEQSTQGAGLQTALTVSELDALRAQMQRCWTIPAGAADPASLVVTVRVWLNPDGTLGRAPVLSTGDQARLALGDPYFRVAAESALRAVNMCQPYKMPIEKYSSWRELEMRFDPRQMLGG